MHAKPIKQTIPLSSPQTLTALHTHTFPHTHSYSLYIHRHAQHNASVTIHFDLLVASVSGKLFPA